MKRYKLAIGLATLVAMLSVPARAEDDSTYTFGGSLTATSQYIALAGFTPDPDPSLQTSLSVSRKLGPGELKLSYWNSCDADECREHDGTLSYNLPLRQGKKSKLSGSIIANHFEVEPQPEEGAEESGVSLQELQAKLTLERGPWTFTGAAAHDHKDGDGWHTNLGVGRKLYQRGNVAVDLSGTAVGFHNYSGGLTGLAGVRFDASVSVSDSLKFGLRFYDAQMTELSDNFAASVTHSF